MKPHGDEAAVVAQYRTTTRFKDALQIIAPNPERRKECEYEVASALWGIKWAAKLDKPKAVRAPPDYRKDLRKLAKRLRADIKLAARAFPLEYQLRVGNVSWIGEERKRHLEKTEKAINWTGQRVRKGSPRQSYARIEAFDAAYLLLKKYDRRPTRGRQARVVKLARMLFGNENADFSKYIKPRLERLKSVEAQIAALRKVQR